MPGTGPKLLPVAVRRRQSVWSHSSRLASFDPTRVPTDGRPWSDNTLWESVSDYDVHDVREPEHGERGVKA